MTDQLFPIDTATTGVEFVGFETAPAAKPAPAEARAVSVPAKPRRRRKTGLDKRVAVRVWFDGRELARLTDRAAAQGVPLADYLRRRVLRDPRVRIRPAAAPRDDLFAGAEIIQTTVVRLNAPLSPEMEMRIAAYFSPGDRRSAVDQPPEPPPLLAALPPRPNVMARLTTLLMVLAGGRWQGQRAAPPAGT